jgi:hypothetical protein
MSVSTPARNLDVISASRQITSSRRAAGRKTWDYDVQIKHIIHRDQSRSDNAYSVQVAQEIATALKAQLPIRMLDITHGDFDAELDDIVEGLSSMAVSDFEGEPEGGTETLNFFLSELYDWADCARVFFS